MRSDHPLAIVTGGARRVGRAVCIALAQRGCDIEVTYRTSDDEAKSLVSEIERLGRRCTTSRLDLNDLAAVQAYAERIGSQRGRVDVLVHNASVYESTPIGKITADAAERHLRVNAAAPLLLTQGLADSLRRSTLPGGGAVVAFCDIHALGRPRKDHAAYGMSKAALTGMVHALARDLAPEVRVNGVAPGVVAFPEEGPESDPEMQRKYLSRVPLGRSGTPEDAAGVAAWLALDAAYLTGEVIRVDGGRWLD
ncbi:MAG: SDR family oxidoreductase [Planctomycetota bacterium]|nr:SDR family oxidoreductase [Planctomycetota bacterium]